MNLHEKRGLIFDLDNTLIDRDAAFRRFLQTRWWPGLSDDDWSMIASKDASGYTSRARFHAWFGPFAAAHGVALDIDTFWPDMQAHLGEFVQTDMSIIDGLRQLRNRYSIAILTNGSSTNQRTKLRRSGLESVVDHVIVSQEVGSDKPDRAAFEHTLNRLSLGASETVMIGDHPIHDIQGATAAGIDTIWVSHGRAWQGPRPGLIYASIDHVLDAFDQQEIS